MVKNFNEKCYEKVKLIPKGMITTYAYIARSMGSNAYRAVGKCHGKKP